MHELDFCKQMLGLHDPWQVEEVEIDQPSHRLDIFIGFGDGRKKGLFKGRTQPHCPYCNTALPRTGEYQAVTLRHLQVAGLRTFLHLPPPNSVKSSQPDCDCMQQWAANPDSKFTEAMLNFVVQAIEAAPNNQIAAKITGISSSDVREISEQTGAVSGSHTTADDDEISPARASETSHDFDLIETGEVPPAEHDGWQRLINGDIPIQTDSVALRMLLQRVRSNLEKNPSADTRLVGAHALRQFFIKHQQQLAHELESLRGEQLAMSGRSTIAVTATGLPSETDPVWQDLIKGKLRLDTRIVGLQMMIERLRQSIEHNPSPTNEQAGVRILRQFFGKHQNRLSHELGQIRGGSQPGQTAAVAGRAAAAAADQSLPTERDPVWQQLIRGDLNIQSEVLSLKMLLERIRQALNKNPTEANRLAGAKILRQYFTKNRYRHEAEIRRLLDGASATPVSGAVSISALPAYNHPNWQRLINGDIAIHTDAVSLKMLLERIRQAIAKRPTEANRLAGAKMLRQYFTKNPHRHAAEINSLAGFDSPVTQAGADDEVSQGIPDINHPSWQRLINGELQILTDAVGLKMMLERIRLSIESNPSEASRLAGAKILRQYFIKHQHKHRAELDQLRAA